MNFGSRKNAHIPHSQKSAAIGVRCLPNPDSMRKQSKQISHYAEKWNGRLTNSRTKGNRDMKFLKFIVLVFAVNLLALESMERFVELDCMAGFAFAYMLVVYIGHAYNAWKEWR